MTAGNTTVEELLSSGLEQGEVGEEGREDAGVENISLDDGETGDTGQLREIEERSIVSAISSTFLCEVPERVMESCTLYGGGGSILTVTRRVKVAKRNQRRD